MTSCWNLDSYQRPKFANLQCDMFELLEAVAEKESSPLQQVRTELKDKRMIVLKDQIHLTSTVGHGKHLSQTVIALGEPND